MFEGKDVKVLLSSAGSGKTRRLIEEVSKELETRRPEEIAFVTFTRKGAEEGLKRVCNKLRLDPEDLPYFRTLHSLTFHAMNYKASQMFGRLDQRKFNKEYGYNVNRCEVNTGKVTATKDSQYLDFYDLERSGALTSKQLVESDIEIGYYRQLVQKYEEYKSSQCLVDFFDCLIKYVREGDSLPCKVLFVDECFSPETKVRMADMTVKEIKDIKTGDFVMGTGTSLAGGIMDVNMQQALHNEALDFARDNFGYQLGNIKALPNTLNKVSSIVANSKLFPFVEYYTCTNEERQAFEDKLKYNGMSIGRIGHILDFKHPAMQTYIKGQIIRLEGKFDTHMINEIANEFNKGWYI